MDLHRRHDLTPATVSVLADALFAYMEKLASLSLKGYLEAKAQSNDELEAGRRRLLRLLLTGSAAPRDLVAEHAEPVGWAVPDRVTLVALPAGRATSCARSSTTTCSSTSTAPSRTCWCPGR